MTTVEIPLGARVRVADDCPAHYVAGREGTVVRVRPPTPSGWSVVVNVDDRGRYNFAPDELEILP